MSLIPKEEIEKEAWKFYIVIPLWIGYFFLIPKIYNISKPLFFTYVFFVGNYLFTLLGYLIHETWHKYVPNIPNEKLHYLYGIMIFLDPQIYKIVHGIHHSQVHTYDDLEFYPVGEVKHKTLKKIYRFLEVVIGTGFLIILQIFVLPKHPRTKDKFSKKSHLISLVLILVLYYSIANLSIQVWGVNSSIIFVSYGLTIWAHSFFLHQSQMVEHGFLIIDGGFKERAMATRNVDSSKFLEKVFLKLTHDDPKEHVFHHTMPREYLRPFKDAVDMPKDANKVTLKQHLGFMIKGILGEDFEK